MSKTSTRKQEVVSN